MSRFLFPLALAAILISPAFADDAPKKGKPGEAPKESAEKTPSQTLKEDPNDTKAIIALVNAGLQKAMTLAETKPDDAAKLLTDLKAELEAITPDKAEAKQLMVSAKQFIGTQLDQIEIQKIPLADLEKRLDAEGGADDIAAVTKYGKKVVLEVTKLASDNPAKADELLKAARERLAKVEESAKEDPVKRQVTVALRQFTSVEKRLEGSRKLAELVGKSAAPLNEHIQHWVNGEAMKDEDFKGKVVLLDFWAVWCGPCIATFPHLKEWNEKYSDKGLVIVGLTNYYNFKWNDDTAKAARAQGKVTPEDENEMLTKFAEHHSLHHRFAVQKEGSSLSEYYAVSGIPHVVLIDQEGKVRLVKVGSGPENAKAIGDMIEKLLPAKAAK
ncbi:MAG: redoxin family protein [Pirellulaceae bacterium]